MRNCIAGQVVRVYVQGSFPFHIEERYPEYLDKQSFTTHPLNESERFILNNIHHMVYGWLDVKVIAPRQLEIVDGRKRSSVKEYNPSEWM